MEYAHMLETVAMGKGCKWVRLEPRTSRTNSQFQIHHSLCDVTSAIPSVLQFPLKDNVQHLDDQRSGVPAIKVAL